jgi:transposase-like protein
MYIIAAHKKGISSVQLAKDLGVTQKTAWFMLHRIREALKEKNSILLQDVVQADEVYVGGLNHNKHAEKKLTRKDGPMAGKTVVMGIMHQSGYVTTKVIPNVGQQPLASFIREKVKPGTILVTDDHQPYKHLDGEYKHVVINHSQGNYGRGAFHTNTIEGFWAIFKRGYIGIYHYMSPKHLARYFDEFSFRYNYRKLTDGEKFTVNLSKLEGRLSYKMLVYGQGSKENSQENTQALQAQGD